MCEFPFYLLFKNLLFADIEFPDLFYTLEYQRCCFYSHLAWIKWIYHKVCNNVIAAKLLRQCFAVGVAV